MRVVSFGLFVLLTACRAHPDESDTSDDESPPAARAGASVCLSRDVGDAWDFRGDYAGTVIEEVDTGFVPLARRECYGVTMDRGVSIRTDEGTIYAIGWKVRSPDGDVTPGLGLAPGDRVGLHIGEGCGEGCGHAFSVTRDGRLVGAVTDGAWGATVGGDATPGLTVREGAERGRTDGDCGTVAVHDIRFEGDSTLDLLPYASGTLNLGGQPYTVHALDAYSWVEMRCTDLPSVMAWSVVAQAP
jgi:hypothetical protein